MGLSPGTRLGPYEIRALLGAGGMGEVYRARDEKLRREVAVKILPAPFAEDPHRRERFEREAQAIARLSHPNILAVHDFGTEQGLTYVVTELLEGESLRERIERSALPWRKAVEVGAAVAEGLAAAHSKGVTHRDLKPENIFLTSDGQVKILDFGLAQMETPPSSEEAFPLSKEVTRKRTEPGVIVGTVGYMSPEQVAGRRVDSRTDIFSLGCVLYEMLTGKHAFGRDTAAETPAAILKEEPPELAESGISLPPELIRVVKHSLEKNPEQRFQSARDLGFDLRAILTDSGASRPFPVSARPSSRVVYALGAGLVLVLIVAAVLWMRPKPAARLDPERVVVAVFENQTGDASLDSLGRTAADWITHGLSQANLAVVPTSEVSLLAGGGEPSPIGGLRFLAERTGAGIVVSGGYYLLEDTLSFQARITDAAEEKMLCALVPVGGSRDASTEVIEKLRQRVMGALAVHFDPSAPRRVDLLMRPPTFEAYKEWVAGHDLFGTDYARAIRHFERAMELDPMFMVPRLEIAVAYDNLREYAKAESALQVLREKRDQLTPNERGWLDWHTAWLQGNTAEALRVLREMGKLFPKEAGLTYLIGLDALEINRPQETVDTFARLPQSWALGSAVGYWGWRPLAHAHHVLGNHQKELEVVEQGREHYPDVAAMRVEEVRALVALGRLAEVRRAIEESMTLASGEASPGDVMLEAAAELRAHGHPEAGQEILERALRWYEDRSSEQAGTEGYSLGLAEALYLSGRWEEARTLIERLASEKPEKVAFQGYLGALAARRGDRKEALRISTALERLDRRYLFGEHTYWRARIAALLGERQRAVDLLQGAFAQGYNYDVHLHHNIDFETLRDYAPFQELLRPKG